MKPGNVFIVISKKACEVKKKNYSLRIKSELGVVL